MPLFLLVVCSEGVCSEVYVRRMYVRRVYVRRRIFFEREFCNFPQNVDFSGARVDNVFRQYNYGGFYERRMQPQL